MFIIVLERSSTLEVFTELLCSIIDCSCCFLRSSYSRREASMSTLLLPPSEDLVMENC